MQVATQRYVVLGSKCSYVRQRTARSEHHTFGASVFFPRGCPGSLPKPIPNLRSSLMNRGPSLIVTMLLLVGVMPAQDAREVSP